MYLYQHSHRILSLPNGADHRPSSLPVSPMRRCYAVYPYGTTAAVLHPYKSGPLSARFRSSSLCTSIGLSSFHSIHRPSTFCFRRDRSVVPNDLRVFSISKSLRSARLRHSLDVVVGARYRFRYRFAIVVHQQRRVPFTLANHFRFLLFIRSRVYFQIIRITYPRT